MNVKTVAQTGETGWWFDSVRVCVCLSIGSIVVNMSKSVVLRLKQWEPDLVLVSPREICVSASVLLRHTYTYIQRVKQLRQSRPLSQCLPSVLSMWYSLSVSNLQTAVRLLKHNTLWVRTISHSKILVKYRTKYWMLRLAQQKCTEQLYFF